MKTILVIALVCLTVSCNAQSFDWLIGTWKLEGKPVFEVWTKPDEGEKLVGVSFKVTDVDTLILEKLTFNRIEGSYYYISDVAENDAPVAFKVTHYNDTSFVAENPVHDFPKTIKYTIVRKANAESLHAAIEGNGKVIPYTFRKPE